MQAVRVTLSPKVENTLKSLRRFYPTLSDAEIFKLSLSKLQSETINPLKDSTKKAAQLAAWSMNLDGSLDDSNEDIYNLSSGKPVDF
ncbi:MAG: hypothetical protein V4702_06090 [Patescibacteria group bacterium]